MFILLLLLVLLRGHQPLLCFYLLDLQHTQKFLNPSIIFAIIVIFSCFFANFDPHKFASKKVCEQRRHGVSAKRSTTMWKSKNDHSNTTINKNGKCEQKARMKHWKWNGKKTNTNTLENTKIQAQNSPSNDNSTIISRNYCIKSLYTIVGWCIRFRSTIVVIVQFSWKFFFSFLPLRASFWCHAIIYDSLIHVTMRTPSLSKKKWEKRTRIEKNTSQRMKIDWMKLFKWDLMWQTRK